MRIEDWPRWLDPKALGSVLFEVAGEGQKRSTRRIGPFTSVEHVLQRQVKLP